MTKRKRDVMKEKNKNTKKQTMTKRKTEEMDERWRNNERKRIIEKREVKKQQIRNE